VSERVKGMEVTMIGEVIVFTPFDLLMSPRGGDALE
jgi:hypothetical protein